MARGSQLVVTAAAFAAGCGGSPELKSVAPLDDGGADASEDRAFMVPMRRVPDAWSPVLPSLDGACATRSVEAERLPFDLYLMLDTSYSMNGMTASGQGKWDAVRAAVTAFLRDGQSAGLGVGIQYFPQVRSELPEDCFMDAQCGMFGPCRRERICDKSNAMCETNADCPRGQDCVLTGICRNPMAPTQIVGCAPAGPMYVCSADNPCREFPGYCGQRDRCEASVYATPAVPIAPLPGATAALVASLNQRVTSGLTPTVPALAGAIDHARLRLRADPGRGVAVVLATDGFPTTCSPAQTFDMRIAEVTAIATAGRSGTPPISTFVIGVFAPDEQSLATTSLARIAQAGGTSRAYVVNTAQNVTQELVGALNQIRAIALPCEYKIPAAMMGEIDFGKVNVHFTTGSGQSVTIGNVRDRSSCNATLGGWYYDANPASGGKPTTIIACDATCNQLKTGGRVDIVLGCKTIVYE